MEATTFLLPRNWIHLLPFNYPFLFHLGCLSLSFPLSSTPPTYPLRHTLIHWISRILIFSSNLFVCWKGLSTCRECCGQGRSRYSWGPLQSYQLNYFYRFCCSPLYLFLVSSSVFLKCFLFLFQRISVHPRRSSLVLFVFWLSCTISNQTLLFIS